MEDIYFASKEGNDLGLELKKRKDDFYNLIRQTGYWYRAQKSYYTNYGYDLDVGANNADLARTGRQGEVVRMGVNHYANIVRHMLNLTTAQKPEAQPIATNTDYKSYEQVVLANGLLEYYSRDKRVARNLKTAAHHAILFGEGWVSAEWDEQLGEPFSTDPQTGQELREGDIRIFNPSPIDVIRDISKSSHEDNDWFMIRVPVNAHVLAARFPELSETIIKQPRKDSNDLQFRIGQKQIDTDEIYLYVFYHAKNPAIPEGKHAIVLDDGTWLYGGPLPYREVPLWRIAADDLIGTPHGHTPLFDLLCIQQALNALYSAVITNQTTFGVQVIVAPKGHDLDYQMLSRGLAFIEYDSKLGKPEALNLTQTPAEIFAFIDQLERQMETLSGVNSTLRGAPESSLKSGSALALVQSQAVQFSSALQASYAALVEDVYTGILNILKDYAKTKRVVNIVGVYQQHMLKSFDKDSLSEINRVVVDVGSPISKTLSGRLQIAENLINAKLISSVEQYMAVLDTGKLEPIVEGQRRELMLVRDENEKLAQGIQVRALAVDSHRLHIQEHRCVLAKPEMRDPANAQLAEAALMHILEHVEMLKTTDPNLLNLLGEQSLMLPMPTPEEVAGGTPEGGRDSVSNVPVAGEAPEPRYPTNPQTGEKWTPEDGGVGMA